MTDSESPEVAAFLAVRESKRAEELQQAKAASDAQDRIAAIKKLVTESAEPAYMKAVELIEKWALEANEKLPATEKFGLANNAQSKYTKSFQQQANKCTVQYKQVEILGASQPALEVTFEGPGVKREQPKLELIAGITGSADAFVWKTHQGRVFGDSDTVARSVWHFFVEGTPSSSPITK